MTEVASVVAGEATKSLFTYLEREIGYLFHFRRNVNDLKDNIERLKAKITDVERLIATAENNNEVIREAVLTWQRKSESTHKEATQLKTEAGDISKWFRGWCTCSRFSIGRQAEKKNNDIKQLLDEKSKSGDIVSDPLPFQNFELVSAGDFGAFTSREDTTKEVIAALKDDEISLVGIFGMPGVGKTMLMEEIAKQVKKDNLFQEVVTVSVSENPNLEKIQRGIAKRLDLKLDDQDETLFSVQLLRRLNTDKKTLIVLDDIWRRLDLAKVGIPCGNNKRSCKVVFTTRQQGTCDEMAADIKIEVAVLSELDSWSLFQQKAGDVVNSSTHQTDARDIVRECKGLPLAIVTLGRALANKDAIVFADTLKQLQKSIYSDDMGPVTASIRLSYNFLQNGSTKLCFLLCCLFPEDFEIKINALFCYVMGERILKDVDNLEEARKRLHSTIEKLISSCLLIKNEDGDIMMHDVVRDVAISIASEEGNEFIVKAGMRFEEWPDIELEKCKRLSLMDTTIRYGLPDHIKAPQLLTLSLQSCKMEIPHDFFEEMKSLSTLDLSRTDIHSLPSSISILTNLRTLCMDAIFNFVDVSSIEKLERLEVLSIRYSRIQGFPEEMGKLTSLKLLDLSHTQIYEKVSPKIISGMFRLEELYAIDKPKTVTLSEVACLPRLTCLEIILKPLQEWLPQNNLTSFENLKRFKAVVSPDLYWSSIEFDSGSEKFERSLFLELRSTSIAHWIKLHFLKRTNYLYLYGSSLVDNILGLNYHLKRLDLKTCNEMKYLMSTSRVEKAPDDAFCNLEVLNLIWMSSLEGISDGTLPRGTFHKLKVLSVRNSYRLIELITRDLLGRLQNLERLRLEDCRKLKTIIQLDGDYDTAGEDIRTQSPILPPSPVFLNLRRLIIQSCHKLKCLIPMKVFRHLSHLEEIYVSLCGNMEILFPEDDNNEEKDGEGGRYKVTQPLFKSLHLDRLPNLWRFSERDSFIVSWPSLEHITVDYCVHLRSFPLDTNSVPKLKQFDVDLKWFKRLECADDRIKTRLFQTFFPEVDPDERDSYQSDKNFEAIVDETISPKKFVVGHCNEVITLIPSNLILSLQKIEYLKVKWCWALQNIFQLEGEDELVHTESTQSNITHLPSSPIFPDLRIIDIYHCNRLKYLFPMRVLRRLSELMGVYVTSCDNLEILFPGDNNVDEDKAILPLLKVLSIKDLPKLSRFTERDSFVFYWPSLERLSVEQCEKLKRLPLGTDSAPKLRKFETDWEWFEGLEWADERIKTRLLNFLRRF